MAWPLIVGAVLAIGAAAAKSSAQKSAGEASYRAALYESTIAGRKADAMEQEAGQMRAASQRAAIEEERQADLAASRARAVAGASGAGVGTDPTVVQAVGDIGYEGELRALTAMYQGEEAGRGLEYQAELERARGRGVLYSGQVAKELGNQQATQTLIGGAGQAFGMFGKFG